MLPGATTAGNERSPSLAAAGANPKHKMLTTPSPQHLRQQDVSVTPARGVQHRADTVAPACDAAAGVLFMARL